MSSKQVPVAERSRVEEEILRAVRGVRFGSVEVVIHDSRVVQIERREKVRPGEGRLDPVGAGRAGPRHEEP